MVGIDDGFLWCNAVFSCEQDVNHGCFEAFERGDGLCEAPVYGYARVRVALEFDLGCALLDFGRERGLDEGVLEELGLKDGVSGFGN